MKEILESLKLYLQEILTILLPGSFLLVVFGHVKSFNIFLSFIHGDDMKREWLPVIIFLSAAYFIGHFLFFFGRFIDDLLFDLIPKSWKSHEHLVERVKHLKMKHVGIEDKKAFSAFKYSCVWLKLKHPEAYSEVIRTAAESKFFRSMVVSFTTSVIVFLVFDLNLPMDSSTSVFAIGFALLAILSLVPYLHLRKKTVELACQLILTAHADSVNLVIQNSPKEEEKETKAPC